jgi:hypothetical protein
MRLIHSKSDGSRAADDRPILDMFDEVPLWLTPRYGFLRPFCTRAAEEWENTLGKQSLNEADGYQLR